MYRASGNLVSQNFTQSFVTNTTITVPAGVQPDTMIELNVSIEYNNGGGGLKDLQCQVTKNGTYLGERFVGALSGIYFVTGSYLQQFTVSAGDTIAIQFSKSNSQSGGAVSSRSQYTIKQV